MFLLLSSIRDTFTLDFGLEVSILAGDPIPISSESFVAWLKGVALGFFLLEESWEVIALNVRSAYLFPLALVGDTGPSEEVVLPKGDLTVL